MAMAALLLAACASQPQRADLPPIAGDPQAHQQQREAALAMVPAWSLAGRVALSNGRDGGSGRLDWRQDGARYEVALSAPVTRQSWRLSGQPGSAMLEGLEGGPRQGADAEALLRDATRWEIPVDALASWIRGARADKARFGAASLRFGDDGRLSGLEQGGWRIDYGDWRPIPPAATELPHRLNAVRGEARVRLVVDTWQ
jgi:outer membrane lipoprotein LolB